MNLRSEYISSSPEETIAIGEKIASVIKDGAVVLLYGNLGSGKTVLSKGIGKGLECPDWEYIRSPSFTIVNEHEGRVRFYHLDLYRLEPGTDIENLGLRDFLGEAGTVAVIEWAEKLPNVSGLSTVAIHIEETGASARKIIVER